jgi:hypothetical protein
MAHYKRRRRKKGGVKGHCYLCAQRDSDGTRNGRLLTAREQEHLLKLRESLADYGLPGRNVTRASLARTRRS